MDSNVKLVEGFIAICMILDIILILYLSQCSFTFLTLIELSIISIYLVVLFLLEIKEISKEK